MTIGGMPGRSPRGCRWVDAVTVLLIAAGVGILVASFRPGAAADAGGAPPLPAWRRDAQPLDLPALAAAPGLTFPPGSSPAGEDRPPLLALFVLGGRACSSVAGEVADYAAQLAELDGGRGRIEPLALVLDPSPQRARHFATAASLPVPAAHGWDAGWSERLGRYGDERQLLQQLVLIDRGSGTIVARVLLSTAVSPAAAKRRHLEDIFDVRAPHAAASAHPRRDRP